MAKADFTIKTGDTAPPLIATLEDATANAVNLTAATIKFIMTDKASGVKQVEKPASLTDAVHGIVTYQWETGDTDIAGVYNAEFEVAWSDGTFETFPNSKYIIVKILLDLGGVVPV